MMILPNTIGPPAAITVLVRSPVLGLDLTTVTAANLLVRRSDTTVATWAATIVGTTASELLLQYSLQTGDVTVTGPYTVGVQLVVGNSGNVPSSSFSLLVTTPYDASPNSYAESWVLASSRLTAAAIKLGWVTYVAAIGGSTIAANPFQPQIETDTTNGALTLNLWTALDGDRVLINDYKNLLSGGHGLTIVAAAGQEVPTGGGAYGASVTTTTAGTLYGWVFDGGKGLWVRDR